LLAALIALTAAASYGLRRWLWPKVAIACRIDTGVPRITGVTSPLVTTPELQIEVEIEPGLSGQPRGLTLI
jgi:hypothetical protein